MPGLSSSFPRYTISIVRSLLYNTRRAFSFLFTLDSVSGWKPFFVCVRAPPHWTPTETKDSESRNNHGSVSASSRQCGVPGSTYRIHYTCAVACCRCLPNRAASSISLFSFFFPVSSRQHQSIPYDTLFRILSHRELLRSCASSVLVVPILVSALQCLFGDWRRHQPFSFLFFLFPYSVGLRSTTTIFSASSSSLCRRRVGGRQRERKKLGRSSRSISWSLLAPAAVELH